MPMFNISPSKTKVISNRIIIVMVTIKYSFMGLQWCPEIGEGQKIQKWFLEGKFTSQGGTMGQMLGVHAAHRRFLDK